LHQLQYVNLIEKSFFACVVNSREIVKKHKKAPARAFNMSMLNNNSDEFQQSVQMTMQTMQKSVTITAQRSNSLDYLNFEEKRQLIASSLSLSDILSNQVGPVVAQAAKDAASSVIGKLKCAEVQKRLFKFKFKMS
jgi:hypothetical protein